MTIEEEIRARVEDTVAPLRNEITQLRSELARAHDAADHDVARANDDRHVAEIADLHARIAVLDTHVKAAQARAEAAATAAEEFRKYAEAQAAMEEAAEEEVEEVEEEVPSEPVIIEAPLAALDGSAAHEETPRRRRGFFTL